MLVNNIQNLIGNTPLLKLQDTNIYAKLEYFNPLHSVKDRPALNMIIEAEKEGKLKAGGHIIEPTSGNTGIALAYIGKQRGYNVILTMPSSMSEERKKILRILGAELVLTEPALGMKGAIEKAEELVKEYPNSFMPAQFDNLANVESHKHTAEEIVRDLADIVPDYIVLVFGSGGTISGLSKYLKKKYPKLKTIAVEPAESPLMSKNVAGPHGIQGIGANFIPSIVNKDLIDEVITVRTEDAKARAIDAARTHGTFIGISAGAALEASLQVAKRDKSKVVVTVFPDTAERYLSAFDIDCN